MYSWSHHAATTAFYRWQLPGNSLLRAGMLSFPRISLRYFQDIPTYFLCGPSAWSNLFGSVREAFLRCVFALLEIYI